MELHGRTLLLFDYMADLKTLLEEVDDERERQRLLDAWYGGDDPDLLGKIRREFDLRL